MTPELDGCQLRASEQNQTQMERVLAQKRAILRRVLVCPSCRGDLKDEPMRHVCAACGATYPTVGNIARFTRALSGRERQVKHSFDHEHRRYLDSRYTHFGPPLVDQWLADVQLPADYFKGKLVLDAGCGSGRWTYAMASLGATVVAVDFTDGGLEVTYDGTAQFENVAVVQASIFNLPLRAESFDFIVSWGVLHHTPDTRAAFERLVPLTRKGGQLYVMIYEKHNPVKFFFTDLIRWCLRRLPEGHRYQACKALLIRPPFLYSLLANLIICAPYPESGDPLEISTRQFGLYDAYAPVFNHLHRRDEVVSWFRSCNFDQITLTKPVRHTHKRDIFRSGECGGSVKVRGIRT